MPIRFLCQRCERRLSIARRKAGTTIECPKCGFPQPVPGGPDTGGPMAARVSDSGSHGEGLDVLESVYLEEMLEPGKAAVERPPAPPQPPPAETDSAGDEMVLVSRRTIYALGALLATVGVIGLIIGYLIGGAAPVDSAQQQEIAAAKQVPVEGKLVYRAGDQVVADERAVVILLPTGRKPDDLIGTPGIRPDDSPAADFSSLRDIRDLGGAYARADENGEFSFMLREKGEFYVVLISAAVQRPKGENVGRLDMHDLRAYFNRPAYLIGKQKYHMGLKAISGFARIEHDFGRDGE